MRILFDSLQVAACGVRLKELFEFTSGKAAPDAKALGMPSSTAVDLAAFQQALQLFVFTWGHKLMDPSLELVKIDPFDQTSSSTLVASTLPQGFCLYFVGDVSLIKRVGSYKVCTAFGQEWFIDGEKHRSLGGTLCEPAWMAKSVPAAKATLNVSFATVEVTYDFEACVVRVAAAKSKKDKDAVPIFVKQQIQIDCKQTISFSLYWGGGFLGGVGCL